MKCTDSILYIIVISISFQCVLSYADKGCSLWVHGTSTFDVTDMHGNPRNNPDNTLYPNDAFSFTFTYYFADTCIEPYVDLIQESGAVHKSSVSGPEATSVQTGYGKTYGTSTILIPEANICHGGPPQGGGGTSGYDTTFGQPRDCGYIQLTIHAYSLVCTDTCVLVPVSDTATITPDVIAPITHIDLYRHMLLDPDGYPAINLDTTYYAWDPISIEHDVKFLYNNERNGTISFVYDVRHTPLIIESGFECSVYCHHTLHATNFTGIGFTPYSYVYGNGDGMYVYAAPSLYDIGIHTIQYDVTVLNLGTPINKSQNHTDIDIVYYEPDFEYYSYGVLDDGQLRSYGNRHGVIIHYMGSDSHERRAKITDFVPYTLASSESALVAPHVINQTLLHWNSTWAIHDTQSQYDDAVLKFYDVIHGYNRWPAHPYHSTTHNISCQTGGVQCHAIFAYAGYGAIRFSQNITDVVLTKDPYKWYNNVTITNKLYSNMWAGHRYNEIIQYTYVYPHTELANFIRINKANHTIHVDIWPPYGTHIPIHQYIWNKTFHDTDNTVISDMHLSEMYNHTLHHAGDSTIQIRLNKTALTFLSDVLHMHNYTTIFDIPIHEALEYEAHLNMTISIHNKTIHRVIPYEFDVPYVYTIYHGQPLNVTTYRYHDDMVHVVVPSEFGTIHGKYCNYTPCRFDIQRDATYLTIHNEWNDTLTIKVPPLKSDTRKFDAIEQYVTEFGIYAIPIIIISVLSYVAYRRLHSNLATR